MGAEKIYLLQIGDECNSYEPVRSIKIPSVMAVSDDFLFFSP
jgi:hypothetical protein